MNSETTSTKPTANSNRTEIEPQESQPESGDSFDDDVRQSSPVSDRVKDKPQEAPEEA